MCIAPKFQAPPKPVQQVDAATAGLRERQRRANASGFQSTILTSSLGDTTRPATAPKTLLGQ